MTIEDSTSRIWLVGVSRGLVEQLYIRKLVLPGRSCAIGIRLCRRTISRPSREHADCYCFQLNCVRGVIRCIEDTQHNARCPRRWKTGLIGPSVTVAMCTGFCHVPGAGVADLPARVADRRGAVVTECHIALQVERKRGCSPTVGEQSLEVREKLDCLKTLAEFHHRSCTSISYD